MIGCSQDLARRSAERLANELGQELPALLEARLHAGSKLPERYDLGTVIGGVALILQAAQFAWEFHRERTKNGQASPTPEIVARKLRLELDYHEGVSAEQRDKIIKVVVEEVLQPPTS